MKIATPNMKLTLLALNRYDELTIGQLTEFTQMTPITQNQLMRKMYHRGYVRQTTDKSTYTLAKPIQEIDPTLLRFTTPTA
jgi:DNA-binding IclR family transcriptional regulator